MLSVKDRFSGLWFPKTLRYHKSAMIRWIISNSLTCAVLTYMSIRVEIGNRISEERLFLLSPAMPGSHIVRPMFVSLEIKDLVLGPWDDAEWEERCGQLRADLDRYIECRRITVAARPYHARTAYMAQLDELRDEAWEIRSRDPEPSLRVFGRFADTDWFVALTWWKRADLKGPDSREWRDAIEGCKAEWRRLFPTYPPKTGANVNDYISTNVFLV
jgi:hypothetical protein